MGFDFDTPVERRGTGANKWDRYRGREIIPMWVADMDFRSPPAVLRALQARVSHGVFGYSSATDEVGDAVVSMCARRFGWHIEREWLVWFPGLGAALTATCRAFGADDDEILVQPPVYGPFLLAPERSRRRRVLAPLACDGTRWEIDFDALHDAVTPRTRAFLFCNPHNPVGRVYQSEELKRVAEFCARYDLVLCSDEIHCDLVLEPQCHHQPVAHLVPELASRSITLMSASKTFNLAGLHCAFGIVPDADTRSRLRAAMAGVVPAVNVLGCAATAAAYRECEDWRMALLSYLRANSARVVQAVAALPGLAMIPPQATYLAWIDARELPVADPGTWFEQAGVGLSDGAEFGWPGYVRLNFGCPRGQLEAALERMADAVQRL